MLTAVVTGAAGYLGATLTARLLQAGYNVRAVDNVMYDNGYTLLPFFNNKNFRFFKVHIQNSEAIEPIITGANFVINLAALVGEPVCKTCPKDAVVVNQEAVKTLAQFCRAQKVRFFTASTCSNYGIQEGTVDESASLQPISLYATTKVNAEEYLIKNNFDCTILRFATLYGLAARTRFDLLLHEFIKELWIHEKLNLFGPDAWRPVVHVDDAADAIMLLMQQEDGGTKVYNVGSNDQNYTKRELAMMVADKSDINTLAVGDSRSYRVDFSKIAKLGWKPRWEPERTVEQILDLLYSNVITEEMMLKNVNG